MQITKYRKVAIAYPQLSLEAEVILSDGRTVYANIAVNREGEPLEFYEDNYWIYDKPLDKVNLADPQEDYADIATEEAREIAKALIEKWNNFPEFPIYFSDLSWTDVEREKILGRLLEENKDEDEMTPEEKDVYEEYLANLYGPQDDEDESEEYQPSATAGDYSPCTPWNAPGMSVRDFI